MGLRIHRSDRADALVRGLGEVLAQVQDDPFTPDVVAVPSRGVERWIAQSLSTSLGVAPGRADGVCANVDFGAPGRLVADVVAVAVGLDPDTDPWAEHRLPWSLLEVLDGCLGEPWCRTLARHLGGTGDRADQGRRVEVAQKLARLFTSYGAQRPSLLLDWISGDDSDGAGGRLEQDLAWQAELFRRLRSALDVPCPAERVAEACERLRSAPGGVDLPDRLSVFGPTRLTTDQVQVLDALAVHRDVHLWLAHPSDALWARVSEAAPTLGPRRDDPSADVPRHPLLASCGRDAREMQVRLAGLGAVTSDEHLPGVPAADVTGGVTGTLLTALQDDLRADRAPTGGHVLAAADRSLQVHACHGRQRQVEVLREVLLGLLEDDPTLEPRDIVVMCPDIEAYAPLISATFGLDVHPDDEGERPDGLHPGQRLTVRLADRALRQTNPVLTFVARLLEMADGRLAVSEVLDLAAMPAVRGRFGFDDDDLERIGDWVHRAGVRWGLDAAGRAPYRLDGVPQNTWQAGLDRLLVGVAMDEEDLRTVGMALPLDDVDSNEADLAGRLAELVDRLAAAVDALSGRQSVDAWVSALLTAVDDLTWTPPFDVWQTAEARRELTDVLVAAGDRGGSVDLGLQDVRALLGDRLRGRPTRANFRTGQLTMCTMVPMRSVPHRVVCLLGVDDGVFPRGLHADGDDVLARSPQVGERDARSEDRQLFLDAVLAAQERLVVLYTGADERTGALRPPAVPLGELLDVVSAMTGDGPGAAGVLVRHPLQPFDARNFVPGDLGHAGAFSFDAASYDGARALLGPRTARPSFLAQPLLDDAVGTTVEVEDLVAFLEHPVKSFLRRRLGVSAVFDDDEVDDALPVELDALAQWAIGERLLGAGLAGVDPGQAVRAEWLRGDLPPGPLGQAVMTPVLADVGALVQQTAVFRSAEPDALDVRVDLDDGTRVVGTVPGVYGDLVVRVTYSKLAAKHRLRAWVQVLVLAASQPDRGWGAATVGRGREGLALSRLSAPGTDQARELLADLVALYRAGQRAPLPLAPKTSGTYAERRSRNVPVKPAQKNAERDWRTNYQGRDIGEHDDTYHRQVWGDASFDVLLAEPADPDAPHADEGCRFGQLARTLWDPLLAFERRA